jgi:hypothetical protein
LEGSTNTQACDVMRWKSVYHLIPPITLATIWLGKARQDVEQSCFAGPVRANYSRDAGRKL